MSLFHALLYNIETNFFQKKMSILVSICIINIHNVLSFSLIPRLFSLIPQSIINNDVCHSLTVLHLFYYAYIISNCLSPLNNVKVQIFSCHSCIDICCHIHFYPVDNISLEAGLY